MLKWYHRSSWNRQTSECVTFHAMEGLTKQLSCSTSKVQAEASGCNGRNLVNVPPSESITKRHRLSKISVVMYVKVYLNTASLFTCSSSVFTKLCKLYIEKDSKWQQKVSFIQRSEIPLRTPSVNDCLKAMPTMPYDWLRTCQLPVTWEDFNSWSGWVTVVLWFLLFLKKTETKMSKSWVMSLQQKNTWYKVKQQQCIVVGPTRTASSKSPEVQNQESYHSVQGPQLKLLQTVHDTGYKKEKAYKRKPRLNLPPSTDLRWESLDHHLDRLGRAL